jgi:hypothetical protein
MIPTSSNAGRRRFVVPRHWVPLNPKNPDPNQTPEQREESVRKKVEKHGGELEFFGWVRGKRKCFALVNTENVADPDAMIEELGKSAQATKLFKTREPEQP